MKKCPFRADDTLSAIIASVHHRTRICQPRELGAARPTRHGVRLGAILCAVYDARSGGPTPRCACHTASTRTSSTCGM